jgi:hypothetical protein
MTLRVDVQALDSQTPLRLYLYDCSAEQKFDCKLWDMPFEATAQYTIRKPDAGAWRVVVLPYAADVAAAPYALRVIQTNDKYGHAQSQAAAAPKASGASWRVTFDVDIDQESVPKNAKLVALIELRDLDSECAEQQSIDGGGDLTQRPVAIGQALVSGLIESDRPRNSAGRTATLSSRTVPYASVSCPLPDSLVSCEGGEAGVPSIDEGEEP